METPSNREVTRLAVKLKIITGTYLLQSNSAAFNQSAIDPTCLLCRKEPETLEHFLLSCETLDSVRRPIYEEICAYLRENFQMDLQHKTDSKHGYIRIIF